MAAPAFAPQPSALGKVLPFSCSTNLSNDVIEQLYAPTMRLTAPALRFCLLIHRRTFGNAGWQRKRGDQEPGLWCPYDLAGWATALEMDRSNLRRIVHQLVSSQILLLDGDGVGDGFVGWNTAFIEWQPYDTRGAKPKSKQPSMVISINDDETGESRRDTIEMTRVACLKLPCPTALSTGEMTMPDCLEGAEHGASEGPEEKISGRNISRKERPSNDGESLATPVAGLPDPVRQKSQPQKQTTPLWPERQDGETDRTYYIRAIEPMKNKIAALTHVAHEKLGVPEDHDTCERVAGIIKAMKRQYPDVARAGLVLLAILQAAAETPDDDKLNYLHGKTIDLARREQEKKDGRKGPTETGAQASQARRRYGRPTHRELAAASRAHAKPGGTGIAGWGDDDYEA